MGGIVAGVLVAVKTGAITLPTFNGSASSAPSAQSDQPSLASQRMQADRQWAAATCTNILDWKHELHHDETSLDLGFGPAARIRDAIAATTQMVNKLHGLGVPPTAQTGQGRAHTAQLLSDIDARTRTIEGAAGSVASGHLAAIGTLLGGLKDDTVLGTQIASELRHVISVDLGLSLAETQSCRQLAGLPI
jgi:hypothetical protein